MLHETHTELIAARAPPEFIVTRWKLNQSTRLNIAGLLRKTIPCHVRTSALHGLIALHIKFQSSRTCIMTVTRKWPSLPIRINASNLHFPQPQWIIRKKYHVHKRIRIIREAKMLKALWTRYKDKKVFLITLNYL